MGLRKLSDILDKDLEAKIDYIRFDIARELNAKNRGRSEDYPSAMELYKHIFNGPNEKPRGELDEFRTALVRLKDTANCLAELVDLYYQGIRFDDRLKISEKNKLTEKIFQLGRKLHLQKVQVIDGCIIKYTSRAIRGKDIAHESKGLEDYLGGTLPISRGQRRRVMKEITGIMSLKDYYQRLASA